jgi:predicted lipid-binding transport protein (Tim44 family)
VFDIFTIIIFLALAVFIFLRLRSVLGQRTGRERPPYDPYSARGAARSHATDKVVTLPSRPAEAPPRPAEASQPPEWNDDTQRSDTRYPDPLTVATGASNWEPSIVDLHEIVSTAFDAPL